MTGAGRRFFQFFRYLLARLTPADEALIEATLPPALAALFRRLAPGEQVHSLRVLRILHTDGGPADRALFQAALLHDVGKIRAPVNIWERVAAVLARRFLPQHYARWAQAAPRGWRKAFVMAVQHPAWGAELAAQAGATEPVVELIRRHQLVIEPTTDLDRLALRLQNADRNS